METNKQIDNNFINNLIFISKMKNIEIQREDFLHKLGKMNPSQSEILKCAKEYYKINYKKFTSKIDTLHRQPLPLIVELDNEKYTILLAIEENHVLIYDFETASKQKITKDEFKKIYLGNIVLIAKQDDDTSINNFSLSWFIKQFFKQKIVYHILLAAFVIQIFALVTPLFTMIIIDKVFSSSGQSTLEVLIIGLFVIAIFDFVISFFRKHLLSHITNIVDITMVSAFFKHLTSLPLSFFVSKQSGDTVARFKEIEFIRNFISSSFLAVLIDFPFGIIFLIVMFLFSPTLTMIVLVAICLMFLLYGVANAILKEKLKKKIQINNDMQSYLFDCVSSIETIKSMSIEPTIRNDYEQQLTKQVQYNDKTNDISNNISLIAGFINKGTVALCLWIGAMAVLDDTMTAGQLIAFNMLIGRIMAPAQRIAQAMQQIYQVKISIKRVKEIFNTNQEIAINTVNTNLPPLQGDIVFENVSFKYADDLPLVLDAINFKIKSGEILGIVGRSGSGKTTISRLLQRLYTPNQGKILIDGIDISVVDPNWLRRQIGIVMQDNILLNKTIKENILLANPIASFEDIQHSCVLCGADSFIKELPKGYDTIVGERGTLLSTGQRQRIAIARALINNPKILIFDEATNAIDFESEMIIQKNLKKICENRTVIIISHRVSVLKITNKIISLFNGKIIEADTKENLLQNKKGYFHALCKAQNILSEIE